MDDEARLQSLFDRVATHLLTQEVRAWDTDNERCMYRDDDGRSCAVGCLIEESKYSYEIEGRSLSDGNSSDTRRIIDAVEGSLGHNLNDDEVSLLTKLQHVHDAIDIDDWRRQLACVAESYGLSLAVLDAFSAPAEGGR